MSAQAYYHLGMEKGTPKIQVQDIQSHQVLFECALEDSEKAYQFAAEMEEAGLDIQVLNPTLAETISTSLGLSNQEKAEYFESMDEELEQHEGSCCFGDQSKKH